MKLSVIIVNWNTKSDLQKCLTALHQNPPSDSEWEIIVTDNASKDGSAQMVKSEFPDVVLLANTANRGYAAANNQAARLASGEFLLLLNPDVFVHKNALTTAINFMTQHPKAAALGGKLVGTDGETQPSVRGFPDPLPVLWEAVGLAKIVPKRFGAYRQRAFDYDKEAQTDQPMGSFLLLRKAAWDEVGPFDPQFPIFFNEVDWCFRAKRQKHWEIWYAPSVTATHVGGASTRQVKPLMIVESHRSLLRFYAKHFGNLPVPIAFFITRLTLWSEARQLRKAFKQTRNL